MRCAHRGFGGADGLAVKPLGLAKPADLARGGRGGMKLHRISRIQTRHELCFPFDQIFGAVATSRYPRQPMPLNLTMDRRHLNALSNTDNLPWHTFD